jgi:ABC-type antimicrobial peptide transport system permease subunit
MQSSIRRYEALNEQEDKTAERAETEMQESYLKSVVRRFKYHKVGYISFWILAVIAVLAVLAPLIAPYDPDRINAAFSAAPYAAKHILGTDQVGRDQFSTPAVRHARFAPGRRARDAPCHGASVSSSGLSQAISAA